MDKLHATQPKYHLKAEKHKARTEIINFYRKIKGIEKIADDKGYWTLCNKQPNHEGSEINQCVAAGLISENQFFGVDYDVKNEGIIEFNKKEHPKANWFDGDWLSVIEDHYEIFNPALVHFDYTRTIIKKECHRYVARTMDLCPSGTVLATTLMLSNGHSKERYDPETFIPSIHKYLLNPNLWTYSDKFYPYKSSRTEMGIFAFVKE